MCWSRSRTSANTFVWCARNVWLGRFVSNLTPSCLAFMTSFRSDWSLCSTNKSLNCSLTVYPTLILTIWRPTPRTRSIKSTHHRFNGSGKHWNRSIRKTEHGSCSSWRAPVKFLCMGSPTYRACTARQSFKYLEHQSRPFSIYPVHTPGTLTSVVRAWVGESLSALDASSSITVSEFP